MKTYISDHNIKKALDYCQSRLAIYNIQFTIDEIRGPSRVRELNGIRALIAHILRKQGNAFARIGTILNRDHSMIIHLLKHDQFTCGRFEDFAKICKALDQAKGIDEIKLRISYHEKELLKLQNTIDKLKKKL